MAARFESDGQVLIIRVRRDPVTSEDPYRIRWQAGPAVTFKDGRGVTLGVSATAATHVAARGAFGRAVKQAMAAGWKRVQMRRPRGKRPLTIKQIPGPGKAKD